MSQQRQRCNSTAQSLFSARSTRFKTSALVSHTTIPLKTARRSQKWTGTPAKTLSSSMRWRWRQHNVTLIETRSRLQAALAVGRKWAHCRRRAAPAPAPLQLPRCAVRTRCRRTTSRQRGWQPPPARRMRSRRPLPPAAARRRCWRHSPALRNLAALHTRHDRPAEASFQGWG